MKKKLFIAIFIILFITISLTRSLADVIAYLQNSQLGTVFLSISTNQNTSKVTTILESPTINKTNGNQYWLNSGAMYYVQGSLGQTIQGDLSKYSQWRLLYSITNPTDTDDGYHPQNIFRLITKNLLSSSTTEEVYMRITKDNLSKSPNRNISNGIFLMSRYVDADNLYYAGIRVDGTAVIKEKINGVYHTLAQKQVFSGDSYNRDSNPNLLPKHQWIGMKMKIQTIDKNTVKIDLFLDPTDSGSWDETLSTTDTIQKGATPIFNPGRAGMRTDFMDVEFRNYTYTS